MWNWSLLDVLCTHTISSYTVLKFTTVIYFFWESNLKLKFLAWSRFLGLQSMFLCNLRLKQGNKEQQKILWILHYWIAYHRMISSHIQECSNKCIQVLAEPGSVYFYNWTRVWKFTSYHYKGYMFKSFSIFFWIIFPQFCIYRRLYLSLRIILLQLH